jgi:hypothetical protein
MPDKARATRLSGAPEAIWIAGSNSSDPQPDIDEQIAILGVSSLENSAYVGLLFLTERLPEPKTL